MKHTIKPISLLLVLLMVSMLVISCVDINDKEEEGTTLSTTDPDDTQENETTQDNLPNDLNFEQQEIRIISRDSDWVRGEIASDDQSDLIGGAIYRRNIEVEDRLNVKIVSYEIVGNNYSVSEAVRAQTSTGTDDYDILANSVYSTIMYTNENFFHNLYGCDYLDLTQHYWSQGFNEAASIGNAQYMCTGSIALTLYRYMFVTFFNKNMLEAKNAENLYEVVDEGRWTLDYQRELAAQFYNDMNGDGVADAGDTYGFLTTNRAYIDAYWSSCNLPILTKDAYNMYVYSPDKERMSTAVDKILDLWYNCVGTYIVASVSDSEDQLAGTSALSQGNSAMVTLRLVSVESADLRAMTQKYGIIPIPKMDEAQKDYYTFLHDQFTAFAIISTVDEDNMQMMGAFLEALASESYKTVVPTYYDIALKKKYTDDIESGKMLDMIYDSIYIDAGVLYTKSLSSVHQQLRTIITSQNNTVVSTFKTLDRVIEQLLKKLNESIISIQ